MSMVGLELMDLDTEAVDLKGGERRTGAVVTILVRVGKGVDLVVGRPLTGRPCEHEAVRRHLAGNGDRDGSSDPHLVTLRR